MGEVLAFGPEVNPMSPPPASSLACREGGRAQAQSSSSQSLQPDSLIRHTYYNTASIGLCSQIQSFQCYSAIYCLNLNFEVSVRMHRKDDVNTLLNAPKQKFY